ncbi:MAG: hypothetical protein ACOCRX_05995 [Candidatus Woesearchaeota archaeon]
MKLRQFDYLILKYLLEHHYLSRNILFKYIGKDFYGHKSNFHKRIRRLKTEGFIEETTSKYTFAFGEKLLLPTNKAKDYLKFMYPVKTEEFINDGYSYLLNINPDDYFIPNKIPSKNDSEHNYKLARLRFILEENGLTGWRSDRILSSFIGYYNTTDIRWKNYLPDAYFIDDKHDQSPQGISSTDNNQFLDYEKRESIIELELSLKSKKRYRKLNKTHEKLLIRDEYKKRDPNYFRNLQNKYINPDSKIIYVLGSEKLMHYFFNTLINDGIFTHNKYHWESNYLRYEFILFDDILQGRFDTINSSGQYGSNLLERFENAK